MIHAPTPTNGAVFMRQALRPFLLREISVLSTRHGPIRLDEKILLVHFAPLHSLRSHFEEKKEPQLGVVTK
jgi:hypothetical protein